METVRHKSCADISSDWYLISSVLYGRAAAKW